MLFTGPVIRSVNDFYSIFKPIPTHAPMVWLQETSPPPALLIPAWDIWGKFWSLSISLTKAVPGGRHHDFSYFCVSGMTTPPAVPVIQNKIFVPIFLCGADTKKIFFITFLSLQTVWPCQTAPERSRKWNDSKRQIPRHMGVRWPKGYIRFWRDWAGEAALFLAFSNPPLHNAWHGSRPSSWNSCTFSFHWVTTECSCCDFLHHWFTLPESENLQVVTIYKFNFSSPLTIRMNKRFYLLKKRPWIFCLEKITILVTCWEIVCL